MFSKEWLRKNYNSTKIENAEIVAVDIACPECGDKAKISIMDEGIREKRYCHNLECDMHQFSVTMTLISSFYLKHEADN